jgi:DNA processing protein
MMSRALTHDERLDWLRLARTENVGPVVFRQMVARFGSVAAALDSLPELARRGGRQAAKIPTRADAQAWLAAIERLGARLVARSEPDYPRLLAECDDAPPLISVKGDLSLFARPTVAIVGARNASLNGCKFARILARDLAEAGYVVVSGLARGIDRAAHEGALGGDGVGGDDVGGGTIAAIACGIDVTYPPEHAKLQEEIGRRGVVVAEMPPGTQPTARLFPRRNRIISGLSLGIVVVEAAVRSGALITARFAADQGREVFAVPGSPLDPRCKGSNGLLRDGATLVEGAADVTAVLAGFAASQEPLTRPEIPGPEPLSAGDGDGADVRTVVIDLLSIAPVAVDELIRQCQFSPAVVMAVLLELELAGRLERHPGNRVSLVLLP